MVWIVKILVHGDHGKLYLNLYNQIDHIILIDNKQKYLDKMLILLIKKIFNFIINL